MALERVLIIFFVLLASYYVVEADDAKEFVLTLDQSNFTQTITKHDYVLVEFYAPWCGHCKELTPEFENAASILSSNDPPVVLAKVDANDEKNKDLANEYDIKSFPTLKVIKDGGKLIQSYKGPRVAEGIVAYMKKQTGPASIEIKSVEDGSTLIEGDKIVIVGVFPELSGEKFNTYLALAEKLRSDYEFAHTLDAKLLPRGDTSVSGPLVRLFKPFDELVVDFEDFDLAALEKFIEEATIPTLTFFNHDPKHHPFVIKYFTTPNVKAMLFVNFTSKSFGDFESKYHDIANEHKGTGIRFLIADVETSKGAFEFYGIREDHLPVIIINNNDKEKYVKPNIEPDHIESWLTDYKDGKVAPYVKSEPVPAVNDQPVKVVVADNFDDIVYKSGKNVLLEFYAPWCGHCKKLGPVLVKVAKSFKDDDVVIAKIDATANDIVHEGFEIKGYPTLYFKSASGKLLQYSGKRTKDKIIDFIKKNKEKTAQHDSAKDEL